MDPSTQQPYLDDPVETLPGILQSLERPVFMARLKLMQARPYSQVPRDVRDVYVAELNRRMAISKAQAPEGLRRLAAAIRSSGLDVPAWLESKLQEDASSTDQGATNGAQRAGGHPPGLASRPPAPACRTARLRCLTPAAWATGSLRHAGHRPVPVCTF